MSIVFYFRIFLQDPFPANPDLLYLVIFIHSNLTTTVTLAFLFGSKVSINHSTLGMYTCSQMCRVKWKRTFEHAQNVRIHVILHMCKVLSGHLLFIETFSSIQ